MKNILILYSEVMGYNLCCFRELAKNGFHVHCIRWDLNKNTPFAPTDEDNISFYLRSHYSADQMLDLAKSLNPELILVSGWMDKDYLKVCKYYKKRIPIITGLDNWWKNSLRQNIASVFSFIFVKPYFSHIFVPGLPQLKFAQKLGFPSTNILTGLYTCDTQLFNNSKKNITKPLKIIFVGRFVEIKGILPFLKCFQDVSSQIPDWSIEVYGNGPLEKELLKLQSNQIKINGFKSPNELCGIFKEATVFCLPSFHEPWGLVIHEATASALPLLVSKNIGACTAFFKENQNGYSFDINNPEEVKQTILKICKLNTSELAHFSTVSYELSKQNSPEIWVSKISELIPNKM